MSFVDANIDNNCGLQIGDLPFAQDGAVGAFLAGRAVVCGGSLDPKACHTHAGGHGDAWNTDAMTLDRERLFASAVALSDTELWITGGYRPRDGSTAASTVVLDVVTGAIRPGIDLPEPLYKHKILRLGEDRFFLAGAFGSRDWILDAKARVWTAVENTWPLGGERTDFFAGVVFSGRDGVADRVVVSGGKENPSVAFELSLDTLTWGQATEFGPNAMGGASVPWGNAFVALGGFSAESADYSAAAYEYSAESGTWMRLGAEMARGKGQFAAFVAEASC